MSAALIGCVVSLSLPYLSVPPSLTRATDSDTGDVAVSTSCADAMTQVMSQMIGQMAAGHIVSISRQLWRRYPLEPILYELQYFYFSPKSMVTMQLNFAFVMSGARFSKILGLS